MLFLALINFGNIFKENLTTTQSEAHLEVKIYVNDHN